LARSRGDTRPGYPSAYRASAQTSPAGRSDIQNPGEGIRAPAREIRGGRRRSARLEFGSRAISDLGAGTILPQNLSRRSGPVERKAASAAPCAGQTREAVVWCTRISSGRIAYSRTGIVCLL